MMMAEHIEREAVENLISGSCAECRETCEEFDGFYADCNQCLLHGLKSGLSTIPAADVRPVVRGKWKTNSNFPDTLICSECDAKFDMWKWERKKMCFCPSCGARMEGAEDKS